MSDDDFIHDDDDRYFREELLHEDYYGKMGGLVSRRSPLQRLYGSSE